MMRKKALSVMLVHFFINSGRGNKTIALAAKLKGQDKEDFFVSLSRGFQPGDNFLARFRFNPCAALLSFLHERLVNFDYKQFDDNMRKYFELIYKILPHVVIELFIVKVN